MGITPAAVQAAVAGNLDDFIAATTPGGIEAQEAEGQRKMVSSFTTLPIGMDHGRSVELGFEIGEPVDELFVTVKAPEGWQLKPTEHSMWSDIIDHEGQKRGDVFYKAAFYDRKASGHWID